MAKDTKLGDTFPANHNVKWGSMEQHESRLSNEWHEMQPAEPKMSSKWDEMNPSSAKMSERYIEMNAGEPMGNEWHEMKQTGRDDPYSMAPNPIRRSESSFTIDREKADNKRERSSARGQTGTNIEI